MLKLSYIQATIFHLYGILIFVFPRIFVQDFSRQMDEYIYIYIYIYNASERVCKR